MPEEPLPADTTDDADAEPIRLKAHTPVWPIAVAAVVAVAAVLVILVTRPDRTATTATTTTGSATPTTAATTGPVSPDPNVLWVPMPAAARDAALTLLDVWDGLDPGTVTPAGLPAGPAIESATVDATDTLVLRGSGAALGTQPCEQQQEVSVLESDTAVVVYLNSLSPEVTGDQPACTAQAHEFELPVPLDAPLGDRALLSLNRWAAQDGSSPRIPLAG